MNLRYAMVPSRDICYAIGSVGAVITKSKLGDTNVKERIQRIEHVQEYLSNKVRGFYENLEKSVLSEGFRNPVLITAGAPIRYRHLQRQFENILGSDTSTWLIAEYLSGGSRLYIAQKHNLEIPCIIKDQVGRFSNCPLISSKSQMLSYFKDIPGEIDFNLVYAGALLWKDLPNQQPVTENKICFTTVEELRMIEEITRAVRGDKWQEIKSKPGFWGHAEPDLLKLHYPVVYRNLQRFFANPAVDQKNARSINRPDPKLIELRRQNAQRLEQSRNKLVAQQNAQRPPGDNLNKFIRFPRNTFP